MSSDVYIDFTSDSECESECETYRIGHLGTMLYFIPYLEWIRKVRKDHPVVTSEAISLLEEKKEIFFKEVEKAKKMSAEEFAAKFGYEEPDWEDSWDCVEEDMRPYIGWTWSVRVD